MISFFKVSENIWQVKYLSPFSLGPLSLNVSAQEPKNAYIPMTSVFSEKLVNQDSVPLCLYK